MDHDEYQYQRITFCDATCTAMGELMFAWGILERELDLGIAALFGVNPTLATCITANLGTRSKVDMLRSGVSMLKACLGETLTDEALSTLGEIEKLTGAARTPVAHGQPLVFDDEDGGGWYWVRAQARTAAKLTVYNEPEKHWHYQGVLVMMYAESWGGLVGRIHATNKKLTPTEIDDACSIYPVPAESPFESVGTRQEAPT
jgi:hypothetical protein